MCSYRNLVHETVSMAFCALCSDYELRMFYAQLRFMTTLRDRQVTVFHFQAAEFSSIYFYFQ